MSSLAVAHADLMAQTAEKKMVRPSDVQGTIGATVVLCMSLLPKTRISYLGKVNTVPAVNKNQQPGRTDLCSFLSYFN